MRRSPSIAAFLLAAALAGGACINPAAAPKLRFFQPPPIEADPGAKSFAPITFRLDAADHLREPMVWRRSEVELVFDEVNRWTGEPRSFLEGALHDALASGPTQESREEDWILHVRLSAFEGLLSGNRAKLSLAVELRDRYGPLDTTHIDVEVPLQRRDPSALARGLGGALETAMGELRAWLEEAG